MALLDLMCLVSVSVSVSLVSPLSASACVLFSQAGHADPALRRRKLGAGDEAAMQRRTVHSAGGTSQALGSSKGQNFFA